MNRNIVDGIDQGCLSCGKIGSNLNPYGDCDSCGIKQSERERVSYRAARENQTQHKIFRVGIYEQNSSISCGDGQYHRFLKQDCGHDHRTVSGAHRCLDRLTRYYPDGSHNGWAHFGAVVGVGSCGHPESLTILEEEKLDEIRYRSQN